MEKGTSFSGVYEKSETVTFTEKTTGKVKTFKVHTFTSPEFGTVRINGSAMLDSRIDGLTPEKSEVTIARSPEDEDMGKGQHMGVYAVIETGIAQ